jgi:signal transduction histidine kinase
VKFEHPVFLGIAIIPFVKAAAVAVPLLVGWCIPTLGNRIFGPIEEIGRRLARKKALVLIGIAVGALATRLSLLWLIPVPVPAAHDEFSYLLASDTFVHGRLTNPAHPMWVFLDTINVNQQPTYMSKYPPAQGAVLAVGQALGHPWIGVLLSIAAMCAATTWMLQGWMPPGWALLGGLFLVARFALFNYWIDSYWGGAVAAVGGALVMGALPRIVHRRSARDAVALGAGIAVLANSRAVEGLLFCLPVVVVLCSWLVEQRRRWNVILARVVLPLAAVLVIALAFVGYYNWRGTGNPVLFPYVVYQTKTFTSPPVFWMDAPVVPAFTNPQSAAYSAEQRAEFEDRRSHLVRTWERRGMDFLDFFLGPSLAAPLLTLPWLIGDHRMRLPIAQLLVSFMGLLAVVPFFVHYAAPLTATMSLVAMQGMRHLRRWQCNGRLRGIGLTRAIVLVTLAVIPAHVGKTIVESRRGISWSDPQMRERARIARELESTPGQHLVIVSYAPDHDVHREWVYNAADVDHAKIVWAREIPGVDLKSLLEYFKGRTIWVVDPDHPPIRLEPFDEARAKNGPPNRIGVQVVAHGRESGLR